MIVTNQGRPLEVVFKPGSESDVSVLWSMELDLPDQAMLYADGAYNCFDLEDTLADEGILFLAKRGSKAKNRLRTGEEEKAISSKRQIVETVFSGEGPLPYCRLQCFFFMEGLTHLALIAMHHLQHCTSRQEITLAAEVQCCI